MSIMKKSIEKEIIEKVIERNPVLLLGKEYRVRIVYKNIKITQLDIENKNILITLPNKYKKISNTEILDLAINKMYEQVAKIEIERAMEKTRIMVGFAPDEFEVKNMNKLAETRNNKISINPNIAMYSREIIDYVVLYQYCNLKYNKNTKRFIDFIEKYNPKYKKCEAVLMNI